MPDPSAERPDDPTGRTPETAPRPAPPASPPGAPKTRSNGPHPVRRVDHAPLPVFDYNPPPGDPDVIHLDETFVVVDKPAGLLAVPGISPDKQDCVRARVAAMFPHATGPMTCHRLDLSTSGVMILALDARTHRNLSVQFEQRRTAKQYLALIEGHVPHDAGAINTPMRKDMERPPLMLVDYIEGKPSVTRYTVLAREQWGGQPATRVLLEPHTGRTHQLRIHAAHPRVATIGEPGPEHTDGLNAPIIGDDLYLGRPAPRLMLHASVLTIHHPLTGRRMSFKAKDPF